MNFLSLVQRAASECGAANVPQSVLGQTGEALRFVNWVNEAWNDIQSSHQDWLWLRSSTSFALTQGQAIYTPVECGISSGNFGDWDRETFRYYTTASGLPTEMFVGYMDYDKWRDIYQFGSQRDVESQPIHATITPDKSLGMGPSPAAGYTFSADYYLAPSYMAANADIPLLPTQFHLLIVYGAMMSYAAFESAQEVYQRGEKKYKEVMQKLIVDQLPELMVGDALT
ncbi:MAG: hypothetical protein V4772_08650 [Pseudomonadota bacterium]